MLSLRKDDVVQVISGRDKGKIGKILSVDSAALCVTVEKINLVKRHMKPTQKNPQGGISEKELPLSAGKVLLFCETCKRGVRHGRKLEKSAGSASSKKKGVTEKASRGRFCKRCKKGLGAA